MEYVYVVCRPDYETDCIIAVFAEKEDAVNYINSLDQSSRYYLYKVKTNTPNINGWKFNANPG